MTCIGKLRELHPDWDDEKIGYYIGKYCVVTEYLLPKPGCCTGYEWEDPTDIDCAECWKRAVFDDENKNRYYPTIPLTGEDMRRLDRLVKRLGSTNSNVVSAALKLYEDGSDMIEKTRSWHTFGEVKGVEVNFDEQE